MARDRADGNEGCSSCQTESRTPLQTAGDGHQAAAGSEPLMFASIHTSRTGPLCVQVVDRGGRWAATLEGAHPALHRVEAAIGATADDAIRSLQAAVLTSLALDGERGAALWVHSS